MWDVALARLRYSLRYRHGRRNGLKAQNRSATWNVAAFKRQEAASVCHGVLVCWFTRMQVGVMVLSMVRKMDVDRWGPHFSMACPAEKNALSI